jgi:NADPH-dependent 2,4-dienoyl-CoA reductase/sulfur reductase-like enzyme/ferredoxin
MAEPPVIEIREWGRPARRLTLSRPLHFGRECDGINLADSEVSRRHLRLVPTPTALSVVDLGSSNGSTVNGVALTGRGTLATGDVIRLGRTEIIVLHAPKPSSAEQPPAAHDPTRTMQVIKLADVPVPATAVAAEVRPAGLRLAERALGIDPTGTRDLFPSYTELPHKISRQVWLAVRVVSVLAYLAVVVLLFVRPAAGLFVFFRVIVPLWPALFFIAPGVWRNICPLSASNQLPRVAGFSRAATAPGWWTRNSFLIAAALFFGIAGARLIGLDRSGPAMGVVLAVIIASAFAGGFLLKGKSGWCSSICPLLPLQRTYGQTPYVTSPNSHCESCLGCAKNCYDFKPRAAWQADMADPEPRWSAPRVLFAAALPGFIIGFFTVHAQPGGTASEKYGVLALFVLVSVGLCYVLQAVTPLSQSKVTAIFAAVAINAYYWFSGPIIADSVRQITGVDAPWLRWLITPAIAVLTVWWLARTRVSELQFAYVTGARAEPVLLNPPKMPVRAAGAGDETSAVRVRFESDAEPVGADIGMSLLDVAESSGQPIEAGCRMGVCGADPVSIVEGMGCLSPAEADELKTLNRLGLGKSSRMACCARIQGGDVTVSLTPERADTTASRPVSYDRSIVSIVVIGNGIAGVTAADFVRRGHPDCEIHLVGAEPHGLYNRMGISRLVYGRSAMQGLYLLPEQWYDDHGVTAWLNTWASSIHLRSRVVRLGTGETLPYDRLILAMGSSAAVPDTPGLNRPGSVVLRSAADAMRIRAYVQERRARHAVVAGGGLLGLEAAYCLHQLGLHVTVLERGTRLLSKQIDARCSQLVADHFARAGITIAHKAETAEVRRDPAVTGVRFKDGRILSCEVFLAATGIRPNVELARDAGLPVGKGVLVDDRMQTRVPGVYAAGDVAEHGGRVLGLWPVATEQAEAAAVNALGGDRTVSVETPPTILKGVELELFSIGPVDPGPGDDVVVIDRPAVPSYRRLVVSRGRAVGATVLGHHPADLAAAQKAVKEQRRVGPVALRTLRTGNWEILSDADRLAY